MYGGSTRRTRHSEDSTLPSADATVTSFTDGESPNDVLTSPSVGENTVYAGGVTHVSAWGLDDGSKQWAVEVEHTVGTMPIIACKTVFVSTLNTIVALNADDGSQRWQTHNVANTHVIHSPLLIDETLYAPGIKLTALNARTGEKRWDVMPEYSVTGIAFGEQIYAGMSSNGDGGVASYTRDGEKRWSNTNIGPVYSIPAVDAGTVYAHTKNGTLVALDSDYGRLQWTANAPRSNMIGPAVGHDHVVVGAGNESNAVGYNAHTGKREWTVQTGIAASSPVIAGETALVTGSNTGLFAVDLTTGDQIHHWQLGRLGSSPVLADGKLLFKGWFDSPMVVIQDE